MPRINIRLRFVHGVYAAVIMNDNNNRISPMQIQDRYFRMLFYHFSIAYAKYVSPVKRKILEYCLLAFALLSLCILVYMHSCFIRNPINCFNDENWPRDGILRVEIVRNSLAKEYSLDKSYIKEEQIRTLRDRMPSPFYIDFFDQFDAASDLEEDEASKSNSDAESSDSSENTVEENVINLELDEKAMKFNANNSYFRTIIEAAENRKQILQESSAVTNNKNHQSKNSAEFPDYLSFKSLFQPSKRKDSAIYADDEYIVEYSLEYGFLRLSPATRKRLGIPVKLVVLDPSEDDCFGSWLSRFLLEYIFGYDQFLMASLRNLAEKENNRGYVHNVVTGENFRFISLLVSHVSLITAAFVMIVFTLSISMLLKYSHLQIFAFIVQILRVLDFRSTAAVPTSSLLIVILALVGMEAIISEFFNDTSTAFYIIIIVWMADLFDSFCCRTVISKRHWLRFFYLYHFAFYAYDFRFSGQYSKLALFTSCCFILHSMIFFFHRYELPAILRVTRNFEAYHDLIRDAGHIPAFAVPRININILNRIPPPADQASRGVPHAASDSSNDGAPSDAPSNTAASESVNSPERSAGNSSEQVENRPNTEVGDSTHSSSHVMQLDIQKINVTAKRKSVNFTSTSSQDSGVSRENSSSPDRPLSGPNDQSESNSYVEASCLSSSGINLNDQVNVSAHQDDTEIPQFSSIIRQKEEKEPKSVDLALSSNEKDNTKRENDLKNAEDSPLLQLNSESSSRPSTSLISDSSEITASFQSDKSHET